MWKSHYYISIALYLTDTWKKREKNMSGFKIISVHEYQNRTRLSVKQIYQLAEMLNQFKKNGFKLSFVIRACIEIKQSRWTLPYTCIFEKSSFIVTLWNMFVAVMFMDCVGQLNCKLNILGT